MPQAPRPSSDAAGHLAIFHPVCDAFALLLQPHAEVVLHDLATETVAYIANNFSRRALGEPSLLQEIDFRPEDRMIGPYEKVNWDGRRIKSISAVLRSPEGRPVGVLCINMDVSHIHAAIEMLSTFSGVATDQGKPTALFKDDWHERINEYVSGWTRRHGVAIADMTRMQKQQLVRELAQDGAFSGKHAAAYISRVLQMGRATVYNYLRDSGN
ncbi:PAS domain-containing protein [Aquamicrobium sp. NLF2-7]|uniref:helix-turn-helix transcriptional regulator n=1 Tax=Aquamicrobium TaxID=69278 RepID=UPI001EFBB979|nr:MULTISPECIES: PAS domain-containing protein [Aquamicrobium]MCG8272153.1 PAS domain-containing protein [Aquamicrobium sp. NLF2-7]MDH4991838.1 PAS domain-containing protein [Aquamicrobium lusatiense]